MEGKKKKAQPSPLPERRPVPSTAVGSSLPSPLCFILLGVQSFAQIRAAQAPATLSPRPSPAAARQAGGSPRRLRGGGGAASPAACSQSPAAEAAGNLLNFCRSAGEATRSCAPSGG